MRLVARRIAGVCVSDARVAALDGSWLLTGGFGERPSRGLRQHLLDGAVWRELPAAPLSDRGGHAIGTAGGLALLHGGYGHGTQQGNQSCLWAASLQEGVPAWRRLSPTGAAPLARAGHTLTAISDNELIMFGGFGERAFDDVHLLRLGSDGQAEWSQLAADGESPGPRCAHAAVPVPGGGGVLTFGGYTSTHGADAALSLLEVSISAAGGRRCAWRPLHAMPPLGDDGDGGDGGDGGGELGELRRLGRSGHSAVVTRGERLQVYGGTRDNSSGAEPGGAQVLSDALSLDVSAEGMERLCDPHGGARWERLPLTVDGGDDDHEWLARYNHAAAVVVGGNGAEEMLIVGGSDVSHMPVDTAAALSLVLSD